MNPLSISQLTERIQSVLETELEPVYWVVGELADFRQAPQGHVYFELVEKQGNQVLAKIRANLWQFTYRSVAAKFESVTGTSLKNGMKVLANLSVNFHPVYGLSVNVKDIDPSFSLGERARIRQETLDRLTREGLLRLNARFELPPVIQKIAVISSPTAAGFGDFVNQIQGNSYGYKLYHKLFPSLMQGNEARQSLINAFTQVESEIAQLELEAVVLIRGGGAQLDLDCFDEYELAAKIANFPIPVFTGIGHERDETIADLVAHTRLKTPTTVAEFLLSGFRSFEESLGLLLQRLDRSTRFQLKEEQQRIHNLALNAKALASKKITLEAEKLKSSANRVDQSGRNLLRIQRMALDNLAISLHKSAGRHIHHQVEKLDSKDLLIRQLDPKSILKRGYTRTEHEGKPIQLLELKAGDKIATYTEYQIITSTVTELKSHE